MLIYIYIYTNNIKSIILYVTVTYNTQLRTSTLVFTGILHHTKKFL